MDFLISSAYAQAAGAPGQSGIMQIAMMAGLFGLMYFMLIRPQTKKAKEHREMVAKIEVGNEVVTSGGLLGRVTEVGESFLTIEVAKGVTVKVQRFQVAQLMPPGTFKSA
jgi:preprotein translocase subunit YajC